MIKICTKKIRHILIILLKNRYRFKVEIINPVNKNNIKIFIKYESQL